MAVQGMKKRSGPRRPDGKRREAGAHRLEQLRERGDVDVEAMNHAEENAERMWHSLGFEPEGHSAQETAQNTRHARTANAVKDELLAAARDEIVCAREESGIDPTVVDAVLRRLDARGTQPE
jgi:CPA1 family monovalent cation:H+ antiporter